MNPICNLVGSYALKMNYYADNNIVKEIDIINLLTERYFMTGMFHKFLKTYLDDYERLYKVFLMEEKLNKESRRNMFMTRYLKYK